MTFLSTFVEMNVENLIYKSRLKSENLDFQIINFPVPEIELREKVRYSETTVKMIQPWSTIGQFHRDTGHMMLNNKDENVDKTDYFINLEQIHFLVYPHEFANINHFSKPQCNPKVHKSLFIIDFYGIQFQITKQIIAESRILILQESVKLTVETFVTATCS